MKKYESFYWSHLTDSEIESEINNGRKTVFLPFGSTEQHGPHLVSGYDYLFAEVLSLDLARYFNGFVLPTLAYGASEHHLGFTATITLSDHTVTSMLYDIAKSLESVGITTLVICNGHGGNYSLIRRFATEWSGDLKIVHDSAEKLLFATFKHWMGKFTTGNLGLHAGFFETSMAMHTHPTFAVRSEEIVSGTVPVGNEFTDSVIAEFIKSGLKKTTINGVIGNPVGSTKVIGKEFYDQLLQDYIRCFENQILSDT
jgi:creatinine amidohydrolase